MLCVVFAALPAFGVILGQIANTPYFGRYFLSALLGFCIPLGVIAGAIRRRHLRPVLVAVVAATLLLNFGRLLRHRLTGSGETLEEPSVRKALSTTVGKPLLFHPLIQNQASKGAEPIAVLDITDFLYLLQYAPQLASRLYYVSPLKRDQGLRALNGYRSWSPVKYNPALTGVQLTTQFKKFYIYSDLNQMETFYKMSRFANIEAFWANGDHYLASMQTK